MINSNQEYVSFKETSIQERAAYKEFIRFIYWTKDNVETFKKHARNFNAESNLKLSKMVYELERAHAYQTCLFYILTTDKNNLILEKIEKLPMEHIEQKWDMYFVHGLVDIWKIDIKEEDYTFSKTCDYIEKYHSHDNYTNTNTEYIDFNEWRETEWYEWEYICSLNIKAETMNLLEDKIKRLGMIDERFAIIHDLILSLYYELPSEDNMVKMKKNIQAKAIVEEKYQ